jgi:UDP-2,3-diacylglucosamine hydrolase
MIRVPRGDTALFASDTHLSDAQPRTGAAFLAALEQHTRGITQLFLLGDLFDAWIGDDVLDDPGCETLALALVRQLAALTARGCAVYYLHGNRDFLLGDGFEARCGASRLPDPCLIDLHGVPTVLTHGDTLCTGDTEYLAFRALSRSPAWQQAFLARPLGERLATARAMRAQSEQSKHAKPMAIMDATDDAIIALLRDSGARQIIHGHTHRPARHAHRLGHEVRPRWVLPDWDADGARGGMLLARDGELLPLGDWPAA